MRKNLQEFCEWESRAAFKPYIEIFALVLEEFRKLAVNDDIIFLQELNTHAQSVAGDETIPIEEVYCRLGTRLRHFLIDEFQDTSRLQWKNIVPLVHEALSYGGSLFYVGDKKQAIFRFRGGDVSLFDSVQEGIKTCKPEQTFLDMNHRSQKEIVQFNNELFSPDNLKRFVKAIESPQKKHLRFSDEDIDRVLKIFAGSEQNWKEKNTLGYVRLERVEAGNIDERNVIMREKLISLIKALRGRFSLGDIAILARENRNVELCTSWLIEEGMPVESRKTLSIREHHLIKELISFLKFLNSPIDNIPFASFISGSIFGKAEEISPAAVQDFLFELGKARKQGSVIYLYREFRKKFPAVWGGLIEEFFRSVGFMPVYELVISILNKFKAVENFPEHQGFFMKFLELIKEKEENYTGIASFLDYFEDVEEKELYVNVAHENSVKITTIHDAKGLEFPVVIVPFLEMDITVGAGGSGARKSHVVKQEAKGLSLIRLKKEYGSYSEKLKQAYREEYIKSLIDELDALYVALTRARYEMYLFVPSKAGRSSNIANILFPPELLERGTREKYKKEEDAQKRPSVKLPASQYSDWIKTLKDEFMEPSQLMNRDRIMHGEVLHCILSCVGNLHPDGKDAAYPGAAREKAKLTFPYVTDLDKYMSVVEKLLQDKKFKPFFYIKEGSLYQEKEVVDSSGNTRRIDRLIVTPREVWVIDYKSSKDESGSHREQIREYMNIVKSLYPGLKPKGFLIYLDTISVEEIHE
jgi:ATP-dependent exoDNAse (exonuclease V) beta subunit